MIGVDVIEAAAPPISDTKGSARNPLVAARVTAQVRFHRLRFRSRANADGETFEFFYFSGDSFYTRHAVTI